MDQQQSPGCSSMTMILTWKHTNPQCLLLAYTAIIIIIIFIGQKIQMCVQSEEEEEDALLYS